MMSKKQTSKKKVKSKSSQEQIPANQKGWFELYLIPESSILTILTAIFLLMLVWFGTRLWWDCMPVFILPFILGLYLAALLKKSDLPITSFITAILASILFPIPSNGDVLLSFFLTAFILYGVSFAIKQSSLGKNWKKYAAYILVAIILTGFLSAGHKAQNRLNQEGYSLAMMLDHIPEPERYAFDGFIYLKVFYLLEDHLFYYKALKQAIIEDARQNDVMRTILGWRLPTIFYIWSILFNSGHALATGFLLMAALTALIGFFCIKDLLLSPLMGVPTVAFLSGYFFYGATSQWIVFMEYWGLLLILLSFWFFIKERSILSSIFALFAPLIRELFIFIYFAGFLSSLLTKRIKHVLPWLVSGSIFIGLYSLHYRQVRSIIPSLNTSTEYLFGGGGTKLVLDSISFSTNYLIAVNSFAPLPWLLGLIGLFLIKQLRIKIFILIVTLLPIFIFLFLGGQYNYYWGITCVPLAYLGFGVLAKYILTNFTKDDLFEECSPKKYTVLRSTR